MTATVNVFKSRWGFHPVDYPTFRKLKAIKKWYYQNLKLEADWDRWNRKEPQNRVTRVWTRNAQGQKCGFVIAGPRPAPKTCPFYISADWAEACDCARRPRKEEDVRPLRFSVEEIDLMYAKLKSWFEN